MTLHREARLPAVAPALTLEGRVLLPTTFVSVVITDPREQALIDDLAGRPEHLRFVVVCPPRPTIALASAFSAESEVACEYGVVALLAAVEPVHGGLHCRFEGRTVCRVEALPAGFASTRAWREVRVRHLIDRPDPLAVAQRETGEVIQAFMSLCTTFGIAAGSIAAPADLPVDTSGLVYRIASSLAADTAVLKPFLAERCPAARRQMVLRLMVRQIAFAQREGLLPRQSFFAC